MSATDKASNKGAVFEVFQGKHLAVLRKRGRAIPIATFIDADKEVAAQLFLDYVEKKTWKSSSHSSEPRKGTSPQETPSSGSPTRLQKLPASTT